MHGHPYRNSGVAVIAPGLTLSLLAVLLLVACEAGGPEATDPAVPNPFRSQWVHAEGTAVELTGDGTGHAAGASSEFELVLRNPTDQVWSGEYCVLLLTVDDGQLEVGRGTFVIEPAGESHVTLSVLFPEELADSRVGLAIVLPERGANVVHVEVGTVVENHEAEWPLVRGCRGS